jgi:hypothetical protein
MSKPSVSIDATSDGLRWKVVSEGETVATGDAKSMEEAQAAADESVARICKAPIAGP